MKYSRIFSFAVLSTLLFSTCIKEAAPPSVAPPYEDPNDYRRKFEGTYSGIQSCTSWDMINGVSTDAGPKTVIVKINWYTDSVIIVDGKSMPIDTSGIYIDPENWVHYNYSLQFMNDSLHISNGSSGLGSGTSCDFNGNK